MLYAIVAVVAIILDQWLKFWVAGNIPLGTGVKELIPGVVSLVNLHNDGAAFGFLSGGNARIYFIILAGVFVLAVIIALATNFISGPVGRWSAVMVAAGGIANCIDRVIYGYVQDMFRFDFWPDFAIFNVADIFITVFAFVFILYIIFGGERNDEDFDDEEEYEDDEEYEEEEPVRKSARREEEPEEKPARKSRQAKYDEEFAQYKARRQAAAPAEAPAKKQTAPINPADPFAEWERANKNQTQAPVQPQQPVQAVVYQPVVYQPVQPVVYQPVQPVQPVQAYQPVQQPVQTANNAPAQAPKKDPANFDLDDILNEFKDF